MEPSTKHAKNYGIGTNSIGNIGREAVIKKNLSALCVRLFLQFDAVEDSFVH